MFPFVILFTIRNLKQTSMVCFTISQPFQKIVSFEMVKPFYVIKGSEILAKFRLDKPIG